MAHLNLPTSMFLLLTFIFTAHYASAVSTTFQAFANGNRVAVFINDGPSTQNKCFHFSNSFAGNALAINEATVSLVPSHVLETFLRKCTRLSLWSVEDKEETEGGLIYPGTNWCGMGSRASNYSDLGMEREVDKCCRDHDNCDTNIPPFKKKYGIRNLSIITRSHCECDRKFKRCLQTQLSEGSKSASIISTIYFDLLNMRCIEEEPVRVCVKRRYFRCRAYELQYRMVNSYP